MSTHRIALFVLAAAALSNASTAADSAGTTNPAAPASAASAPVNPDYAWLTPATLPPPSTLIDAALSAMPRSFREKSDWLARMKKASWVPSLELRYGIGEQNFRTYRTLDSQTEVSTTAESSRESSSQSGQNVTTAADPLNNQLEQSADSGSKSTSTKSTTVKQSGPTSYGVNDSSHWVNDYGVFLTWDLSRILFREEEVVVAGAEKERELFRESVRQQAIQTYYDLKETLLLLENEAYRASIPTKIKKERLAYMLDTMTEGAFSGSRGDRKSP